MTFTARTMIAAVGRSVALRVESLELHCRILDAKAAYGNVRFLVRPLCGAGEQWVDSTRCSLLPPTTAAEPSAAIAALPESK